MNIDYYKKYNLLLNWFSNIQLGRDYLHIPRQTNFIIFLDANSYIEYLGEENKNHYFRQFFYAADNHFDRYLGLGLKALDIASNSIDNFSRSKEALAYYLKLHPAYGFPRLLFSQTTFNALSLDNDVQANDATWATAHNASSGAVEGIGQIRAGGNATVYVIRRYFCRWNTSSLTSNATITAAGLKIFPTASVNDSTTGMDIVKSTATDGTVATTDYPNVGTTVYATSTISGLTLSAYNTFALNATGQGDISKTANTKFAWRISLDTTNTSPANVNTDNSVTFNQSGDANPEQLVVTYTLPGSNARLKSLLGVGL